MGKGEKVKTEMTAKLYTVIAVAAMVGSIGIGTWASVKDAAAEGRLRIEASRYAADHPCWREMQRALEKHPVDPAGSRLQVGGTVICYKGPSRTTSRVIIPAGMVIKSDGKGATVTFPSAPRNAYWEPKSGPQKPAPLTYHKTVPAWHALCPLGRCSCVNGKPVC
jgi:hypothetical protein